MQAVFVYLLPFQRNSLVKRALQSKIVKNSIKFLILGVQGHSRSSLSHLVLQWYCDVTDRQTDERTDEQNYHS